MDLGYVINKLRKQKDLNQTEFADKCGITQTYLSQIECNRKDPSLEVLRIISKELDIPLPIIFYLSLEAKDINNKEKGNFEILNQCIKAFIYKFFHLHLNFY